MRYKSSPYQKNIMYIIEHYPDTPIANIGGLDCYRRRIPCEMGKEILKKLVLMHPSIRLRMREDGTFYLPDYEEPEIACYDCTNCTEAEIISMAEGWLREEIPLYHHNLYELRYIDGPQYSYSFFKFHHLISDGASFALMLRDQELMQEKLFQKEEIELQEDRDYLELLESGIFCSPRTKERALSWYQSRIPAKEPVWKLKKTGNKPEAERISYKTEKAQMQKIAAFVSENGIFYETLVYGAVFAYILGQKKEPYAAIGRVLLNRTKKNMQAYGLYANTLPLFLESRGGESALQYLKRIQGELFEQQKYASYGYEELSENLGFLGSMYDISISYRSRRLLPVWENSVGIELFNGYSEIPLRIFVEELEDQLFFTLQYQKACYEKQEIDAVYERICFLMEQLADGRKPEELSLVTPKDEQLIRQFEDVCRLDYDKSVLEEIELQMKGQPQCPAVCMGGEVLSYAGLEQRMYRVAAFLIKNGVKKGQIVSVCLNRSLWLTAVLLGIWKAGAAFVTIGTGESEERKKKLQSISTFFLSEDRLEEIIAQEEPEEDSAWEKGREPEAADAAYLMYTSGTTGEPKAVMISQKALKIRLLWMLRAYGCENRVLQKTTYTFDVSMWEIFLPLLAGKTSYLLAVGAEKFPDKVGDTIAEEEISMLHFVPTMLQAFLQDAKSRHRVYPQVKTLICSGEALGAATVREACEVFPQSSIANFYGPTECTIDVLHYPCKKNEGRIPIGRPVANTGVYIVNSRHQLLPPEIEGEICVTGDLVGMGYYQMKSAAFGSFLGQPSYDTGDYGWLGFDGNLWYSGRKDTQHKLRGMRIDLAALEDVLQSHPDIQAAAAEIRNSHIEVCCLCENRIPDLKKWLAGKLPPQQLPGQIYFLPSFPCDKNGKLDRKRLWQLGEQTALKKVEKSYTPPADEKEAFLQELIEKELGRKHLSVTEHLLEAGLDSFSVLQVVAGLKEHGISLSYEDFYQYPTIRELAESRMKEKSVLCCLKERKENTGKLFLGVPYAGGASFLYYPLSREKCFREYDFYAVPVGNFPEKQAEWIAKKVCRRLLEIKEYEEYDIFGYCVGSAVAVAIAGELERHHKKVRLCLAASLPQRGIVRKGRAYSYWDAINDDAMKRILGHMHKTPGAVSEETVSQFRADVRRFLTYMGKNPRVPVHGTCRLILPKGDFFVPDAGKCCRRWQRLLGKRPEEMKAYRLEYGGHFFLQRDIKTAAHVIKRALTE